MKGAGPISVSFFAYDDAVTDMEADFAYIQSMRLSLSVTLPPGVFSRKKHPASRAARPDRGMFKSNI